MKSPRGGRVATIDEYLAGVEPETRAKLSRLRATIRKAAPEATEKISYGVPTFYYNGNLVHFAAFKKHIGFYPGPSAIRRFAKELSGFTSAKGSVQFPLDQPLPLDLVTAMVKFRVGENARVKQRPAKP